MSVPDATRQLDTRTEWKAGWFAIQVGRARRYVLRAVDRQIDSLTLTEGRAGAVGSERLSRARVLVAFTLILLLLLVVTVGLFESVCTREAANRIWWASTLASVVALLALRAVRLGRPPDQIANWMIATTTLFVATVCFQFGGIRAPQIAWLAIPPMLSVLLGGRDAAWLWSLVSIAFVGSFVWIETSFGRLPNHLSPEWAENGLWATQAINAVTWATTLAGIATSHERTTERRAAELALANQHLQTEVAQRRRAEKRTQYLAYYDELTTLPNRQLFKERLESALALSDRLGRIVGIMFLDLDGFKEINDAHGHASGDQLLQEVARRIQNCVRAVDTVGRGVEPRSVDSDSLVSRLGGDEFTVLLFDLKSELDAVVVARRILQALEIPVQLDDHEVVISASIGITFYPSRVNDIGDLLRNADLAMYHAKAKGKNNFQFFDEELNERANRRTMIIQELRHAIARNEIELFYQPIFRSDLKRVHSAEALLRWNHPVLGSVSPAEFIPIAEDAGIMNALGDWVLQQACSDAMAWEREGADGIGVAVNVSSTQFRLQQIVAAVDAALAKSGLSATALEIEITEHAMLADEDEAARALETLKDRGIRVALDDFGTGYSSLHFVRQFKVDVIKIDRSFIRGIPGNREHEAIVNAILAMAHELGLEVVAEGIEAEAQERFLRERGCEYFQGYRFALPMRERDFRDFIRGRREAIPAER